MASWASSAQAACLVRFPCLTSVGAACLTPCLRTALAHLIRGAPRGPLLAACASFAALLPECLAVLTSGPLADAALLSSVLTCTCDLLCEPAGQQAAAEQAGPLLAALSALALPSHSGAPPPGVRLTALHGLTAAAELSYTKTFPHRRALLRVLERAVDDPKKNVRAAAVAARTVWAAMPDA